MQNNIVIFTFLIRNPLTESLKLLDFLVHNVFTNETCLFGGKDVAQVG